MKGGEMNLAGGEKKKREKGRGALKKIFWYFISLCKRRE